MFEQVKLVSAGTKVASESLLRAIANQPSDNTKEIYP